MADDRIDVVAQPLPDLVDVLSVFHFALCASMYFADASTESAGGDLTLAPRATIGSTPASRSALASRMRDARLLQPDAAKAPSPSCASSLAIRKR